MTTKEETAITETPASGIEKAKKENTKDVHFQIEPHHAFDFDYDSGEFKLMVEMPGVPKEVVKLKVLPELFDLSAQRESTLYAISRYFPYRIDPESVSAAFENGLLTMKGKFKDKLADAVDIKLE